MERERWNELVSIGLRVESKSPLGAFGHRLL